MRWDDGVVLRHFRWWAELLDSRFRIPGTKIRFGIDPILSLIPGFGDLASPLFTMALLAQAISLRVPRVILVRMVINALLDAVMGAVPIAGNIGDIFWRANTANLALLERHARPGVPPRPGDYAFVWTMAALLGVLLLVPIVLGIWLSVVIWRWLANS
ncbi:MAG TPA: DUF4112 domain-containing protein [Vicinamibacterales bacterium]|nr:DUF4112 domain-containing protein [Vicinamibacterales bacterium]